MDNNSGAVRRSKEEKKVLRKQIKASHTLLKHEGISTTSQTTKVTHKNNIYKQEVTAVRRARELTWADVHRLLLLLACTAV